MTDGAANLGDDRVLRSWSANVTSWTDAVRDRKIESRNLVTDDAVIGVVTELGPLTVLDLGCGEGWLARRLAETGAKVTGVDAIPGLIEQARSAGGGEFFTASYEEIASGGLDLKVDAVVANFSLIGKEAVDDVVRAVPRLLNPGGSFVVQTLHPHVATGDLPYVDGWREGTWAGFGPEFTDPAPWYFRTVATWISLVVGSGLKLTALREPIDPRSGRPASLILVGSM
jgi:2-polyprenyl-3-methyl-5-hydroxy-6-metoxy-1,4-benzoquinol methylase